MTRLRLILALGWQTVFGFCAGYFLAALAIHFLTGCTIRTGDEYNLLGCKPEAGVCRVFNNNTGAIELRALPTMPAERGEHEVHSGLPERG